MSGELEALRKGDRLDFMFEKHPKCPHCGHSHGLSEHDWWHLCEEGEHDVECGRCDRQFIVSTHVQYSFSTDCQDSDL